MNTAATSGSILHRRISSRPRAGIIDYYLSINGETHPLQTMAVGIGSAGGTARMYAELLRSWDQLCDTAAGGIINCQNYTQSNTPTAALSVITSAIGFNKDFSPELILIVLIILVIH
jgi:hypothetical protein